MLFVYLSWYNYNYYDYCGVVTTWFLLSCIIEFKNVFSFLGIKFLTKLSHWNHAIAVITTASPVEGLGGVGGLARHKALVGELSTMITGTLPMATVNHQCIKCACAVHCIQCLHCDVTMSCSSINHVF